MTASFGTPALLPGQPGFRARPSESMARETAEMEERLARLKTDLAAEAEMRGAAGPRAGGARWRSARTDRGSVRAYAKDVKTRHKQQLQQRRPHGIFATSTSTSSGGGGVSLGVGDNSNSSSTCSNVQPQAGAGARAAAALRDEEQQRQHQHRKRQGQDETQNGGGSGNIAGVSRLPPQKKSVDERGRTEAARPNFENKEVSRWGVHDTLAWLDSLGLGKHCGVFQQNEISGPILLEVGLDDLDYMDIRVLAHRKLILKGIELLRRGRRLSNADTPPPPAPTSSLLPKKPSRSGDYNDSGSFMRNAERETEVHAPEISEQQHGYHREEGGNQRFSPGRRKKLHWSAIKPLSENQTQEDVNGSSLPAVNFADGQYDEAAAHSSFADAVAEWRGEGRHATTKTKTLAAPSLHRPSLVGRAPLAGITADGLAEGQGTQVMGDAKPSKMIRRGLLGGGGGESGGATECWTNPFTSPRESAKGSMTREQAHVVDLNLKSNSPPRPTKTVIVVDAGQRQEATEVGQNDDPPGLDEKAEHEAFRRAVAEWRGGGGDEGRAANGTGGMITTTTEALPSRRTTEAMAEELREQMDAEHRRQAKELEDKKRALLDGLDTTEAERRTIQQEKKQLRLGGESGYHAAGGSSSHESDEELAEEAGGDAHSREADDDDRSTTSSARSFVNTVAVGGRRNNSQESQKTDEEERLRGGAFDNSERAEGPRGGVEIEIMESVLGAADLPIEGGAVSYVVDEGDSGDEL